MRLLRIAVLSTGVLSVAIGLCVQGQETPAKEAQVNEAKGMPARATPGDYQAQAQAGTVTIAADFVGHAVPTPEQMLSTEDFVVVEAALFGPPQARLNLSINDFSLRINGKKTPLARQSYVVVARSLKDPEWQPPEPPAKSKSSLSTGGGGQNDSPPPVVHVPVPLQRSWEQRAQKASLPEGDRPLPLAGLMFFQYRSKTQGIRSIELIYDGAGGKATLTLNP
ncbi:MAG TPA: hypothetical protein VK604_05225 [Bryobacteraceae bacterium]|nr:hypothetical protein [Bryobacteraceae bacterium]